MKERKSNYKLYKRKEKERETEARNPAKAPSLSFNTYYRFFYWWSYVSVVGLNFGEKLSFLFVFKSFLLHDMYSLTMYYRASKYSYFKEKLDADQFCDLLSSRVKIN